MPGCMSTFFCPKQDEGGSYQSQICHSSVLFCFCYTNRQFMSSEPILAIVNQYSISYSKPRQVWRSDSHPLLPLHRGPKHLGRYRLSRALMADIAGTRSQCPAAPSSTHTHPWARRRKNTAHAKPVVAPGGAGGRPTWAIQQGFSVTTSTINRRDGQPAPLQRSLYANLFFLFYAMRAGMRIIQ